MEQQTQQSSGASNNYELHSLYCESIDWYRLVNKLCLLWEAIL